MAITGKKGTFIVTAYPGDEKTLLAFNLPKASAKNLAGFTIQAQPGTQPPYYLHNQLQYETPGDHAQDASEPANSTINAPIYKFRWTHFLAQVHQGLSPFFGLYTYSVTPRYFDSKGSLLAIDTSLSAKVTINVGPFKKQGVELGFTRGYTQSQAFVNQFGDKINLPTTEDSPKLKTGTTMGTVPHSGVPYTYLTAFTWMGSTAREKIFALLNEVVSDPSLHLDVCAYDLNEPDIIALLLELANSKRIRVILDNTAEHHNAAGTKAEDQFEKLFTNRTGESAITRGHFGALAHDKVLIVSRNKTPVKVLTGSTNFSVNGIYVNANHVVIFNDATVVAHYQNMFNAAWAAEVKIAFAKSPMAAENFPFKSALTPQSEISFAPHPQAVATAILDDMAARIKREAKAPKSSGSVLFAVMQMTGSSTPGPVYPALAALHKQQTVFSFGISDSPSGIYLFAPDKKTGVLVTGKPGQTMLPAPFNQVPSVAGHEIHHKFVVCGFNGPDPVVYCGSSNLFLNPEQKNGDNLIAMHDTDIATAFAIEALALVDHYDFLDRYAKKSKGQKPSTSTNQAALDAHWYLPTNDKWTQAYFNPASLHYVERNLFS
jgi:hypothetical protein